MSLAAAVGRPHQQALLKMPTPSRAAMWRRPRSGSMCVSNFITSILATLSVTRIGEIVDRSWHSCLM